MSKKQKFQKHEVTIDLTEFMKIRALRSYEPEELGKLILAVVGMGRRFLRRHGTADELVAFANELRKCQRTLSSINYMFGDLSVKAREVCAELPLKAPVAEADGINIHSPLPYSHQPPIGHGVIERSKELYALIAGWQGQIAMAAGTFAPLGGEILAPKKRPSREIEGTVAPAMLAWKKLTGKEVASAKGIEKAGGLSVRPQNDDAYFVYLCTKMVVPDCTPSAIITAINYQRNRRKKFWAALEGFDIEDGKFDRLNFISNFLWAYDAGIFVAKKNRATRRNRTIT